MQAGLNLLCVNQARNLQPYREFSCLSLLSARIIGDIYILKTGSHYVVLTGLELRDLPATAHWCWD